MLRRFEIFQQYLFTQNTKIIILNKCLYFKKIVQNILNEDLVQEIKLKINDLRTFPTSYYGSDYGTETHGTTHISVLAGNGDSVSMTSTINL